MIDFKSYFHDKYKGGENFVENIILPIFGEDKYEDAYEEDVLENNPELITMARNTGLSQIIRLGTINIPMNPTDVFDITVDNHVKMKRNRVAIQQLIRRIMSTYSSAFMVFHYNDDDKWDWRFTFCSKQGNNQQYTDSKRYTFLLGPNQSCRTAADNFKKLLDKQGDINLDDIIDAFDVEALSKEFFKEYKVRYGRFVGHVIGKEYVDKGKGKGEWRDKEGLTPSELFYGLHEDEKVVRDYVKKLLGRIVFLHFLQKKGWLGATDEEWTNGPQDFMHKLFGNASADQQENFLDDILEPLFTCLDTPLNQRREVFDTKVDGLRSVSVPFLGGLFERTEEDKALSIFPRELFADLFKFLSEYNFTIDENDPNDAQVGVDPEMLGRIFENLLEDNKDKGIYYTRKEIVQYMCRESLIAYLQTDVTDEPTREALRQFVTSHDVAVLGGRNSALALNVSQCLKDVKICDPAIGSGAFPMGLLNELFLCRGVIEDFDNAAAIKRHIIEQNIFGVDIEKGAVEIARLRFWLSLITDADKPDVLPNMDFKIMQGNSLLEQYKGFDLSHIMDTKTEIRAGHQFNMFETQIDVIRAEVKDTIKRYYSEQNHDMRRSMRQGIQQKIQQQIAVQGINVDISDIKDIAANDQFFLWHTWFSEVFEENGGFDIVIGNPPYVEAKKLKHIASKLKPLFKVYSGTADLSIYFVEHGINLLAANGILSYITTNKFFNTGYGKPLRKLIISNEINKMINFEQVEVFEGVLVSSVILEMRKAESNNGDFTYEKFYKLNATQFKEQFVSRIGSFGTYPSSELDENEWSFSDVISLNIKKHIESDHNLLGDTEGVNIYRGVTTGYNPAFIIDNAKRDELIAEDPKNAVIIKNMLQGRNIRKWYYNESDENLVFIPWHFPLHKDDSISGASIVAEEKLASEYASLYNHLLSHKQQLADRNHDETGIRYEWYALQRCAASYYDEFEKPEKIIWGLTADKWAYTLDTEGHYLPSNGYILTSTKIPTKYILGLLNSKLLHYYFGFIGVMTAGGAYTLKAATISALPFVDTDDYEPIITLVDRILEAKKLDPQSDTSDLEAKIDRLVYDLYGLTEDEIRIVEGNN